MVPIMTGQKNNVIHVLLQKRHGEMPTTGKQDKYEDS